MKAFFSHVLCFAIATPGSIPLFTIFLLSSSCHKKDSPKPVEPVNTPMQNGLPEEKLAISAYLYAGYTNGYQNNGVLRAYTAFGDPAKNLIQQYDKVNDQEKFGVSISSNISAGTVKLNGILLRSQNAPPSMSYKLINSNGMLGVEMEIPESLSWTTEGNGSFLAIDQQLPQKFPVFSGSASSTHTIYINSDFTLDLKSIVSNYDSVVVRLNNVVSGRVSAADAKIVFAKGSIGNLNPYVYANVRIIASNYLHRTLNDKLYVFELCRRVNETLAVR